MSKKRKTVSLIIFIGLVLLILVGIFLTEGIPKTEGIQEEMRDAVLHESAHIDLFGLEVNPALISAFCVTLILLTAAALLRIFAVPKFRDKPGKVQLLLEQGVDLFAGMAKNDCAHRPKFISAYIFTAGAYIFFGTLFELLGVQAVTTAGASVSLPAPLSDINGAISMGLMTYGVILFGGLFAAGPCGMGRALKDISLPISMSFRLFGALLSGVIVTELVYHYFTLSFVVPVLVGVLFTLLHAIIQAYVLTMLASHFYGESTERKPKKPKEPKKSKKAASAA